MTTRAFDARGLASDSRWRFRLSAELVTAARRADSVASPHLVGFARLVRRELIHGSGVAWISGLPAHELEQDELRRIYLALGRCLGEPVLTYGLLYDVADRGASHVEQAVPVSMTSAETTFHTDSSARDCLPDFVGLLCLVPARSGGRSQVSSALQVHERLAAAHPALLARLYSDYVRDVVAPGLARDVESVRANRFPIFARDLGGPSITFRYMRYWIERGHARVGEELGDDARAAFDLLDEHLSSPAQRLDLDLGPGEMLWVNNRTVAHNRTAYVDGAEPRRLVRMWLTNR